MFLFYCLQDFVTKQMNSNKYYLVFFIILIPIPMQLLLQSTKRVLTLCFSIEESQETHSRIMLKVGLSYGLTSFFSLVVN